jgi:hypothetical protein
MGIKEAGAVVLRPPARYYALTFGDLLLHEGFHLSSDAWRIAWSSPVGLSLRAPLYLAVEVASDTRRRAAGVRGDLFHVRATIRKAQNLGAQAHFGHEIRILLDLSEPGVFFLSGADVS